MITLPASLPQCSLRSGWGMRPLDPNKRTDMDDGDVAVTRKFARTRTLHDMVWELSAVQKEIALDFWQRDLNAGASWFLCPVSVGTCTRLLQCQFHVDSGGSGSPFSVSSPKTGIFHMNFQLATKDLPLLTQTQRLAFDTYVTERGEVEGITAELIAIKTAIEELGSWP